MPIYHLTNLDDQLRLCLDQINKHRRQGIVASIRKFCGDAAAEALKGRLKEYAHTHHP